MLPLPNISGNRIKLTTAGYAKAIGAAVLLVFLIVLYVTQFDHFDKILNIGYFLTLSVLLGLILGIYIGRPHAIKEDDIVEQFKIYMICAGLSIVFMPLFVSLVNRYLDFRTPQYQEAQILDFKARGDQPYGYVKGEKLKITHYEITILLNEEIRKFSTKQLLFPDNSLGDIVQIPVSQGLLDINYLDL